MKINGKGGNFMFLCYLHENLLMSCMEGQFILPLYIRERIDFFLSVLFQTYTTNRLLAVCVLCSSVNNKFTLFFLFNKAKMTRQELPGLYLSRIRRKKNMELKFMGQTCLSLTEVIKFKKEKFRGKSYYFKPFFCFFFVVTSIIHLFPLRIFEK